MANRTLAYVMAFVIFVLDQFTKWFVTGPLSINDPGAPGRPAETMEILPIFNLTAVQNFGISGGLFHASTETIRWALVIGTSAIAAGVAIWISKEPKQGDRLALSMILGGALGNVLDRLRLGYVVDFADLHFTGVPSFMCMNYENGVCQPFLVFNVADAAISIGVVILLLRAFLIKEKAPEGTNEHA